MSGRLGAFDLAAATETTIYTVPSEKIASISISLCNRNSDNASIRIALSDGALSDSDYIEYDFLLCGNAPIERSGVVLSSGQSVIVRSDLANTSALVYGWEEDE